MSATATNPICANLTCDTSVPSIMSVAFSPDSKTLALPGDNKSIQLWNVATGKQIRSLGGSLNNEIYG